MICQSCDHSLVDGLPYCPTCGTPILEWGYSRQAPVGYVSSDRPRTAWRAASTEGCVATAASFVFFVACVALAVLA